MKEYDVKIIIFEKKSARSLIGTIENWKEHKATVRNIEGTKSDIKLKIMDAVEGICK